VTVESANLEDYVPRRKARRLEDCAKWPTVLAITCDECGGLLGDHRGPTCLACKSGMGVALSRAIEHAVGRHDPAIDTQPPGSVTRRDHGGHNNIDTVDEGAVQGRYVSLDPHRARLL
jgi:hypothetical protein